MGSLTLPASGLVYADTSALIYSVETYPQYWPVLEPLWQHAGSGAIKVATSEIALLEALVGPLQRGDNTIATAYEQLFGSSEMRLLPITRPILREAARLRATTRRLRTPDAIHAATALDAGCSMFVTNDLGFRGVVGLVVVILDEVLAA